jgi:hypothetical protein
MQVVDKYGNTFGQGHLVITTKSGKSKLPVVTVAWGNITGVLSDQSDLQKELDLKVPTSRILEINGVAYDLSEDRSWTISTGITVNTTPITGGTSGRLLFDDAGVVGETNGVNWDKVNNILTVSKPTGAIVRLNSLYSDVSKFQFTQEISVGTPTEIGYISNQFGTGMILSSFNSLYFNAGNAEKMRISSSTGNVLINTTTDAGYKLDVAGDIRTQNAIRILNPAFTNGGSITHSANSTLVVTGGPGGGSENITFGPSNRIFINAGQTWASQTFLIGGASSVGAISNPGNFSAIHLITGTSTAASAIARAQYINTTLTASANNDVLVGLDIAPTYTNGAFTGVTNLALRASGNIRLQGSGFGIDIPFSSSFINMQSGNVLFQKTYLSNTDPQKINLSVNRYIDHADGAVDIATCIDARFEKRQSANVSISTTVNSIIVYRPTSSGNLLQVRGYNISLDFKEGSTVSAPFIGYDISGASKGTTGNVTSFIGYQVTDNSISSIVYGFRSLLNSGTGKWGLYFDGTANNYLAGNLFINTTTDAGYKLDVNGTARVTGILRAETYVQLGTNLNTVIGSTSTGTTWATGPALLYGSANLNSSTIYAHTFFTGAFNATSSSQGVITTTGATFNPTSGTAVFNAFNLPFTINQTGGANGITRGLYINPTLTAAADFRAIETTAGSVIFNGPTTINNRYLYHQGTSAIQYFMTSNAWSGTNTIFFGDDSSSTIGSLSYNHQFDSFAITVNGNNRMQIASTGNVLIGTTTDAGYKLDVVGTARVQGVITGSVSAGGLTLGAASANQVGIALVGYFVSSGAIATSNYNARSFNTVIGGQGSGIVATYNGIAQGLTTTSEYFVASGNINLTDGAIDLLGFSFSPTIVSEVGATIKAFSSGLTAASNHYNLYLSGTAKNYIAGNVGIGTTSPYGKLDVKDGEIFVTTSTDANLRSRLTYQGLYVSRASDGTYPESIRSLTSSWEYDSRNSHIFKKDGTSLFTIGSSLSTTGLNITNGGNVLIAATTDAGYKLDVNGTVRVKANSLTLSPLGLSTPPANYIGINFDETPNHHQLWYAINSKKDISGIGTSYDRIIFPTMGSDNSTWQFNALGTYSRIQISARNNASGNYLDLTNSSISLSGPWTVVSIDRGNRKLVFGNMSTDVHHLSVYDIVIKGAQPFEGNYGNSNGGNVYLVGGTPSTTPTGNYGNVILAHDSTAARGNVLIGTSTNVPSAVVNVNSTTQGFLPPRMTNAQMLAIATPSEGLMVYDTTNRKLCCYDGATWQPLF